MSVFKMVSLAFAFGLLVSSASAQSTCARRDELIKVLDEKYHEASSGFGTVGEVSVIEVYTSDRGTFTILSSQPNGISCIIATGQNWEPLSPPKKVTSL